MGVACSPDIFQARMSELMASLEFVRTYLDDLLCISKGSLEDHLNKLKKVLIRLRDAGLTVNARKSSFCAVETEYLGYVLSWDGIKPQPKKVQAILALAPPQNVKQLRTFLGMVQYYRDIWARQNEILAPLTTLVGECGHTKVTRANKTKKKPWHWDDVHQQAFNTVIRQQLLVMLPWPTLTICRVWHIHRQLQIPIGCSDNSKQQAAGVFQ